MLSIRAILTYTLFLAYFSPSLSIENPPQNDQRKESKVDLDAFQKLLDQADPPSLHAALHDFSPKKFKHGMFPEDRTAVEAIHKEEPGVATGILKMAKLAKRQSNGTVPTTPAQQSPEPATTRVLPVPLGGESSTTSGSETAPPGTTVSTNPSDIGSITSAAATTSSSSPSLTAGEVVTTTNSIGLTVISTVGGGATTLSSSGSSTLNHVRSSMTSTLIHTSTLPNGQKSTITAVTVVGGSDEGADTPTGTAGAGSTGTGSGQPGLQTGEAAMTRGCGMEMAVVFGAAVGVAFML